MVILPTNAEIKLTKLRIIRADGTIEEVDLNDGECIYDDGTGFCS